MSLADIEKACRFCEENNVNDLQLIVPKRIDPNTVIFNWDKNGMVIRQGYLLEIASYCGAIECVNYLIENKADIDRADEIHYCFNTNYIIL